MPDWNDSDYFCLFRSIFSSDDFRSLPSGDSRVVMVAVLSETQWAKRKLSCNRCGKSIILERGDAWFTMTALAHQACTTRDVVRTALRRLANTGFLKKREWCKHRLTYRLVNRPKFDELLKRLHGRATDEPRTSHATPTDEPRTSHTKEDVKDVKDVEDETTGSALDLSHLQEAGKTADHLRALCLASGLPCRRIKDDLSWFNVKPAWAQTLAMLEARKDAPPLDEQREIMTWAFSAPSWKGRDGATWSWAKTIARSLDPPSKWAEKLEKIMGQREEPSDSHMERDGKIDLSKYTLPPGYTDWNHFLADRLDPEYAWEKRTHKIWIGKGFYASPGSCEGIIRMIKEELDER